MIMVEKIGVSGFKRKHCLAPLIIYIFSLFYLAVLRRGIVEHSYFRFNLFQCYFKPSDIIIKDIIVNIACFIPLGLLVGLVSNRFRIPRALLVGLLVSLTIEFSQLIWMRGIFDMNDIFNNTIGAAIGGFLAVLIMKIRQSRKHSRTYG